MWRQRPPGPPPGNNFGPRPPVEPRLRHMPGPGGHYDPSAAHLTRPPPPPIGPLGDQQGGDIMAPGRPQRPQYHPRPPPSQPADHQGQQTFAGPPPTGQPLPREPHLQHPPRFHGPPPPPPPPMHAMGSVAEQQHPSGPLYMGPPPSMGPSYPGGQKMMRPPTSMGLQGQPYSGGSDSSGPPHTGNPIFSKDQYFGPEKPAGYQMAQFPPPPMHHFHQTPSSYMNQAPPPPAARPPDGPSVPPAGGVSVPPPGSTGTNQLPPPRQDEFGSTPRFFSPPPGGMTGPPPSNQNQEHGSSHHPYPGRQQPADQPPQGANPGLYSQTRPQHGIAGHEGHYMLQHQDQHMSSSHIVTNATVPPPPVPHTFQDQSTASQQVPAGIRSCGSGEFARKDQTVTMNTWQEAKDIDREKQQHKEQDQRWLDEWLKQKQLWHKPKEEKEAKWTFTVPQARRMLRETMKLVKELKSLRQQLESQVQASPAAWEPLYQQACLKKSQLEEMQSKLSDEFLKELGLKLKRIEKKRMRLKNKRKEDFEEKEAAMRKREEIHASIDRWREGILRQVADAKREKEIKAAADETMSEVRRKLLEIRKMQQLLQALQKLRQLKKESAEKQGRFTPREADRVFKERMDKLVLSVNTRTEIYEAEQKTLEVMLEMEQKETDVRDKEAERIKMAAKTKRKEKQIKEFLFGKDVKIHPHDPLFPSQQYYNQAYQNLPALLQIRREWDMYLVPDGTPGGSRIPPGWVVPVAPASDNWASALKEQPSHN